MWVEMSIPFKSRVGMETKKRPFYDSVARIRLSVFGPGPHPILVGTSKSLVWLDLAGDIYSTFHLTATPLMACIVMSKH